MKCFAWITLVLAIGGASARPNGAPASACSSMKPGHPGSAQNGPSPFVVVPESSSINVDGSVDVVLQGNGATFKGYLVSAFDVLGSGPIGTFGTPSDGKTMSCANGAPNAITHSNNGAKSDVRVTWTPPAAFAGSVVFRATFVQNFATFWVAQASRVVDVTAPTSEASTSTTTTSTTTTTTTTTTPTPTTTTPTAPTTEASTTQSTTPSTTTTTEAATTTTSSTEAATTTTAEPTTTTTPTTAVPVATTPTAAAPAQVRPVAAEKGGAASPATSSLTTLLLAVLLGSLL